MHTGICASVQNVRCSLRCTASFASGAPLPFLLLKVGDRNRKALNLQPYPKQGSSQGNGKKRTVRLWGKPPHD
jgi:hypothetical protein